MTRRSARPMVAALAVALALAVGPVVAAPRAVAVGIAGAVAARTAAECAQPARQQVIPAPTGTPWYATRLGLDHVAGLSLGDGQVVAVLDTGVAPVPALAAALRPTLDLLPDAAPADQGSPPASSAQDCDGRGTVMAGLVAARPSPGLELPGLARAAEILPVRVLAAAGDSADPAVLAAGMTAAVAAGADVLLVGGAVRDDPVLRAATEAALMAGVPVVAAAGDGDDPALAFPAAYDGVIAVAATGNQDTASTVNASGKVSVGAPGVDIVGLGREGGVVGGQAGSALAAALVAATVADVRAAFPQLGPAQLRDRIRDTADRPGVAVPDDSLGWGVVNPVTALTAPIDLAARSSPASGAPTGGPDAVTVTLPPEPTDDSWAIAAAAMLLAFAAGATATVAGVRRARARNWRPPAERSGPTRSRSAAPEVPDPADHSDHSDHSGSAAAIARQSTD